MKIVECDGPNCEGHHGTRRVRRPGDSQETWYRIAEEVVGPSILTGSIITAEDASPIFCTHRCLGDYAQLLPPSERSSH